MSSTTPIPSTDSLVLAQADPWECNCEFSSYDYSSEESTHYLRECECGHRWYGHHCPHDGYQNPCSKCGKRPRLDERIAAAKTKG